MKPCLGLPGGPQCDDWALPGKPRCAIHQAVMDQRKAAHDAARPRPSSAERGITAKYKRNARIVLRNATRCAICGMPPTKDDPLTCGHIVARAEYVARGYAVDDANELSNMQAEHRSCNNAKTRGQRHHRVERAF